MNRSNYLKVHQKLDYLEIVEKIFFYLEPFNILLLTGEVTDKCQKCQYQMTVICFERPAATVISNYYFFNFSYLHLLRNAALWRILNSYYSIF